MQGMRVLSIRDYFNYYFPGVVWLLLVAAILPEQQKSEALRQLRSGGDTVGLLVGGILAVTVPYLVGVMMSPVGGLVTKGLRDAFGDPKEWVVQHPECKAAKDRYAGKRLPMAQLKLVAQKLKSTFRISGTVDPRNLDKWFFLIRAYVVNCAQQAAEPADRNLNLANLSEALLVPIPVILVVLSLRAATLYWSLLLLLILGGAAVVLLARSYLYLREHWVKHVYRAFLVAR